MTTHGIAHFLRGGAHQTGERALPQLPIAERLPLGEVVRLSLHRLETPDEAGLEQLSRTIELVAGEAVCANVRELRPHVSRGGHGMLGRSFRLGHEHPEL